MAIDPIGYRSMTSSSRGSKFLGDLEDYLDRQKKGISSLDSEVPGQLSGKLSSTSEYLSNTNPKLLEKYSGYLTAFTYDKRGRYVSNLDDSFANLAKITQNR